MPESIRKREHTVHHRSQQERLCGPRETIYQCEALIGFQGIAGRGENPDILAGLPLEFLTRAHTGGAPCLKNTSWVTMFLNRESVLSLLSMP